MLKFLKSYLKSLHKKESILKNKIINLLFCNLVRFIFIAQCTFCIDYLITITGKYEFLALIIIPAIIFVDGLYVSVFRDGKEYKW